MATPRPRFPEWNDNNPADMVGYYDRYTGEKFTLADVLVVPPSVYAPFA